MVNQQKMSGFTLVELLIAMFLSTLIVTGLSMSYVTVKSMVSISKNLENAQEVLRFSSQIYSTSLKQTSLIPTVGPDSIVVSQEANSTACDGLVKAVAYTETFTLDGNNLTCDLGAGPITILTGIDAIAFAINGRLVTITVTPLATGGEPSGQGANAPFTIDVALTRVILTNATRP
ncbi:PilW family protein [Psychrobium sp. 1_MG-2023]|uniref:PilW family protein n=1 Tax=Psychrobium sp. 1_MG-2023 TaxID=3062624 RepID=UPI000C347E6D|nr:prepilin-type N-terminal cleavage/methylation domain-containing protein [Psychrobium sp. 1_MG-2023]MDP2560265.1 prepilin-type N-terminal cleavage/methylation domain-containing protein [Psychrobium sp. 1_MG-2023]PKF55382.1 hypothetical protein CW748_12825 [Alteromonadales bacterium alter-6D02]